MNQEHKISVAIQARLEKLLGQEQLTEDLRNNAEQVMQAGYESSNRVQQLRSNELIREGFNETDNKKLDDLFKGIERQFGENSINKVSDMMEEFLSEQDDGLTKQGYEKWAKKFSKLGRELKQENIEGYEELEQEVTRGMDKEKKEKIALISEAVKREAEEMIEPFLNMRDSIRGAKEELVDYNSAAGDLYELLRKGGWLTVAGIATNKAIDIAKTQASIEARERTAFDLASPQNMYTEREMYELYKSTSERSMWGGGIGTLGGGLIAGLATGFNPLAIAGGATFGGQLGQQIADMINLTEESELKEELKFLQQSLQGAEASYGVYSQYEIPATQYSRRAKSNLRGNSDLGYTNQQELMMKAMFSESLGYNDEEKYFQQTQFARATGLNPEEIFSMNKAARITGLDLSTMGLNNAKDFTESLFGQSSDAKRILDVLEAIKDINLQSLQLNINADTSEAMKIAQVPSNLFGVENPYGRIGDLGGKTIDILGDFMKPQGIAHESFLFRALGGDKNLIQYMEKMKGGIFSGNNFEDILKEANKYVGNDEELAYYILHEMLPRAPQNFLPDLSKLISGQEIEITKGVYTDEAKTKRLNTAGLRLDRKTGNYFDNEGNEIKTYRDTEKVDLRDYIENINKDMGEGKDFEKITSEYHELAQSAITDMSRMQSEQQKTQIEIGATWKEIMIDTQKRMVDIQEVHLGTAKLTKDKVREMMEEGIAGIGEKMKELGLYLTEVPLSREDIEKLQVMDAKGYEINPNGELVEKKPDFSVLESETIRSNSILEEMKKELQSFRQLENKDINVTVRFLNQDGSEIENLQNSDISIDSN